MENVIALLFLTLAEKNLFKQQERMTEHNQQGQK